MTHPPPPPLSPITTAQSLGHWVQWLRKQQKITQNQLADATGMGIRFVRELENGKPTCELDKALHVATMLGLKLEVRCPPAPPWEARSTNGA